MGLTGANLIAGQDSAQGDKTYTATDPRTGRPGEVAFHEATEEEVRRATEAASQAFDELRDWSPDQIAVLLDSVAEALEAAGDEIVAEADRETGLGASPRLQGELGRTTGQIRAFSRMVRDGWHLGVIIDTAAGGGPDLRRMLIPLGPVAVFGASNFPLAFSVAGGDTASAWAAGCPVVVKAHPSHPGTSELAGRAVSAGLRKAGAPAGTFSLLHGKGVEVGTQLVRSPDIRAVGFTGSHGGGRALHDLGATRPDPIPVYAEMGSLNPVFVLPQAARNRTKEIAEGFVGSMTLGVGQFCTKPGLVILPDDEGGRAVLGQMTATLAERPTGTMLNEQIWRAFRDRVAKTTGRDGVQILVDGSQSEGEGFTCGPTLLAADLDAFLAIDDLTEEHFGPLSVAVICPPERWNEVVARIPGSLTATIHADHGERADAAPLQSSLAQRAGRVIWNGFPTGVAVAPSMHHGGPYPSTNSLHTSVGMTAVRRFLRPVAFQDAPQDLLPPPLRDDNSPGVRRMVDWAWE